MCSPCYDCLSAHNLAYWISLDGSIAKEQRCSLANCERNVRLERHVLRCHILRCGPLNDRLTKPSEIEIAAPVRI